MIDPLYNLQLKSTGLDGFIASKSAAVEHVRVPHLVVFNAAGYNLYHTLVNGYAQKQCEVYSPMLETAEKFLANEVAD